MEDKADVLEDQDQQSNVGLGFLNDLFHQSKISLEQYEQTKLKFKNLAELLVKVFQNHKYL